jgi:hypothetical protein
MSSLRLECGGDGEQIGTAAGWDSGVRQRFDLCSERGEIGGGLLIE